MCHQTLTQNYLKIRNLLTLMDIPKLVQASQWIDLSAQWCSQRPWCFSSLYWTHISYWLHPQAVIDSYSSRRHHIQTWWCLKQKNDHVFFYERMQFPQNALGRLFYPYWLELGPMPTSEPTTATKNKGHVGMKFLPHEVLGYRGGVDTWRIFKLFYWGKE